MGLIIDEDVDDDADVVGNVSICTPSTLTIKLQNGNVLFGGRFLATVTCEQAEHWDI